MAVGAFGQFLAETGFEQGLANTGQESGLTGRSEASWPRPCGRHEDMQTLGSERPEWLGAGRGGPGTIRRVAGRSMQQIEKDRTHYQAVYGGSIPRNLQERLQGRKRSIEDRKQQRDGGCPTPSR